jgi:hypothetical protein
MSGKIVPKALVEIENPLSDTDESGSYIEVEVDSDGNEIVSGTDNDQQSGMTATVRTASASVGGRFRSRSTIFLYLVPELIKLEINNFTITMIILIFQ